MKYEGEVSELELIPALVELGAETFTGALRFENDSIIKIVYFKEGGILSASTNDRGDSIDEILLKSGKVSREHVKQALSKRKDTETLGDALLGLGFITRKELTWSRRVQLVGILRSVITWHSGSYTLVADYLPKREEGQPFQLEQIVLEVVLTDVDRSKYDELLDSGAAVFRPSASFEERFPSLGLNQEAESVVRLVNGTRSASEVVAESTSDAFNVYKLLHALSLLGLLERSTGESFSLDAPAAPPIEPTVELPIDLGEALAAKSEDLTVQSDNAPSMDFGAPSSPGADASLAGPATDAIPEPTGDLLPSIDDAIGAEGGHYEYEPSIPVEQTPGLDLDDAPSSVESLSSLEIPETGPVADTRPRSAPPKAMVAKSRGGGARNLAILLIGIIAVAGLTYAAYIYFNRSAEEPVVDTAQQATPATQVGASGDQPPSGTDTAATDTTSPEPAATETTAPEPAATETTAPPEPEPVPEPPPTPITQPVTASPSQYGQMASQYTREARGVPFTIQFALLCKDFSIDKSIREGGSDFWFIPITYQGKSCYRAFWGRYATREAAEQGIARVPRSLLGGKAVVVQPAGLVN